MAVANRIKVLRAEANISATALASQIPGGDKVVMSYIENGRALPTKDGLEKMCDVFSCKPADIYAAEDLDLLSVKREPEAAAIPTEETRIAPCKHRLARQDPRLQSLRADTEQHEGMEQVRVWMPANEKAALFKAISGLGYHSVSEWLREKYRATLREYIALNLGDRTLHEAIPPTTEINPPEVDG